MNGKRPSPLARERKARIKRVLCRLTFTVLVGLMAVCMGYYDATYRTAHCTAANVSLAIQPPDGSLARLGPSSRLVHRKGMVLPSGRMSRDVELKGSADLIGTCLEAPRFAVSTRRAEIVAGPRFPVEAREDYTLDTVEEGSGLDSLDWRPSDDS